MCHMCFCVMTGKIDTYVQPTRQHMIKCYACVNGERAVLDSLNGASIQNEGQLGQREAGQRHGDRGSHY